MKITLFFVRAVPFLVIVFWLFQLLSIGIQSVHAQAGLDYPFPYEKGGIGKCIDSSHFCRPEGTSFAVIAVSSGTIQSLGNDQVSEKLDSGETVVYSNVNYILPDVSVQKYVVKGQQLATASLLKFTPSDEFNGFYITGFETDLGGFSNLQKRANSSFGETTDLGNYCADLNEGTSATWDGTPSGWWCTSGAKDKINFVQACEWAYGTSNPLTNRSDSFGEECFR